MTEPTTTAASRLVGFKRHLRAETSAGGGTYLFSERGVTLLKGAHMEALAVLLDGTRDVATLLSSAPDGVSAEQVAGVLAQLVEAGLVTLRSPERSVDEAAAAYWEAAGVNADAAASGTDGLAVRVITIGDAHTEPTLGALRSAGITATAAESLAPVEVATDSALSIVLCDDYLNPYLANVDAAHRKTGQPWLLAKPIGPTVWLGPIFEPDVTGCWHCLAARLWSHRTAEACAQSALGHQGPAAHPVAAVPALSATACGLIALEVTKWLGGYRYPGQRAVWTFDSLNLAGERHELRSAPQCAVCGDPAMMRRQAHRPVVLTSRPKARDAGCGHRALSADAMMDRYGYLVSPITGVVKEIRPAEHGPAMFNSYRSGPNVAARVRNLDGLRAALRFENGGKGVTARDAEVSALCEAVERYSGTFQGDEERITGSLRSLGRRAIHPNDCLRYDERQYADRERWNATHSPFQYVCQPFDERATVSWTPVWSMTQQRHRLLPTSLLYFGMPSTAGHGFAHADSNGSAAGSCLEDAVLQAMLEIVERDAVALWWYNRTRAPAVDLAAFGDQWVDQLRDVYTGLGRELWVLDVTADLRIPTMVAMSRRSPSDQGGPEEIMFGFGAHLHPGIALRRALTELNQLMPAVLAASGGTDGYACDDIDAVNWWRTATVAEHPYLLPDPSVAARVRADYRYTPAEDLLTEVADVRGRFEAQGMEVLVLDQTRPDIGLPVAKVIVPGMRHFWARLAPGRLFDVPVRLGRLAEPTPYAELNPIPMFL